MIRSRFADIIEKKKMKMGINDSYLNKIGSFI